MLTLNRVGYQPVKFEQVEGLHLVLSELDNVYASVFIKNKRGLLNVVFITVTGGVPYDTYTGKQINFNEMVS